AGRESRACLSPQGWFLSARPARSPFGLQQSRGHLGQAAEHTIPGCYRLVASLGLSVPKNADTSFATPAMFKHDRNPRSRAAGRRSREEQFGVGTVVVLAGIVSPFRVGNTVNSASLNGCELSNRGAVIID